MSNVNYLRTMERVVSYIKEQITYENDGDVDELLAELDDIANVFDMGDIRVFIKELKHTIMTIADKNNKCPRCYCDLDVGQIKEVHSHLDDKPTECFEVYTCGSCGWSS